MSGFGNVDGGKGGGGANKTPLHPFQQIQRANGFRVVEVNLDTNE